MGAFADEAASRLLRREPETLVVPTAVGIVLALGKGLLWLAAGQELLTGRIRLV